MEGHVHIESGDIDFSSVPNNTNPSWWKDKGLRMNVYFCAGLWGTFYMNGYDGSLFNGLQTIPQWTDYFNPDSNMLGLMNSAAFIPSPIAAIVSEALCERVGRRPGVWIGALLTIAGALINASSKSVGQYIAGRCFMGFGTTLALTVGPTLCQEIAHPRLRAKLGSLYTCIYYIAAIISALVTLGCRYINSEYSWRIPCYLQVLGPVFTLLMTWNIPESPRWLWKKGKIDKAKEILARFHANGDEKDPLVQLEYTEIAQALAEEEENKSVRYMDFFRTEGNRRRLFVVIITSVGTNWVGNGIVTYYLTPILKSVGVGSPQQTSGINVGLQIWNLILSVGAALLVERLGRRPLWLISTIGMLFSMCVVMGLSAGFANTGTASMGVAVIPFLYIFFGFYDIAWTPLASMYPVEILPFKLRVKGQAIFMAVQTVAVAVNTWVNPVALDAIGYKYYAVYIGILSVLSVIIYFYFPETKNLTIEEISTVFDYGRKGGRAMAANHMRGTRAGDEAEVGSIRIDEGPAKQ